MQKNNELFDAMQNFFSETIKQRTDGEIIQESSKRKATYNFGEFYGTTNSQMETNEMVEKLKQHRKEILETAIENNNVEDVAFQMARGTEPIYDNFWRFNENGGASAKEMAIHILMFTRLGESPIAVEDYERMKGHFIQNTVASFKSAPLKDAFKLINGEKVRENIDEAWRERLTKLSILSQKKESEVSKDLNDKSLYDANGETYHINVRESKNKKGK